MLVSAFAGTETMKAAYAHAIANGYRFYSYGDASCCFAIRNVISRAASVMRRDARELHTKTQQLCVLRRP